jgi:hypothetical protein
MTPGFQPLQNSNGGPRGQARATAERARMRQGGWQRDSALQGVGAEGRRKCYGVGQRPHTEVNRGGGNTAGIRRDACQARIVCSFSFFLHDS